ncbi:DNA-binding XRE family transcriptional regulator [Variovorax boronicumulans]|uniref:DNA-binding XRE family transcriptional regulator n=1 Tax=Variovorax boronicumulans TaxID=436515 RepID=A0AAW8D7N3_9BURK|nr:helix-turn-helix transcriptional regulator [Variovorax boronicumulans]MDP9897366.1 DNA-binding XRE family transcriptional regulator [Variovorax boronicumulans]MDQ0057400.1 DNA-binding XRE family transcriptional regulator [Variovorax boronicumulans]
MPKPNAANSPDVDLVVKQLGQRIRAARVQRGLFQKDVAAIIGVSIPSYQALEAGRGTPAFWTFVASCIVLDISLESLLPREIN